MAGDFWIWTIGRVSTNRRHLFSALLVGYMIFTGYLRIGGVNFRTVSAVCLLFVDYRGSAENFQSWTIGRSPMNSWIRLPGYL